MRCVLAFITGTRGHVGVQAPTAVSSRASSWFPDLSRPAVPGGQGGAQKLGGKQGGDTARIFGEGHCCPYFQRPVTLAFPRVLELQKEQGPVRRGTQGWAAGLHREGVEVSDAKGGERQPRAASRDRAGQQPWAGVRPPGPVQIPH